MTAKANIPESLDITQLIRDMIKRGEIGLQIDVKTAMQLLDYSKPSIYELMNSGALGYTRMGTARRIPIFEILKWLQQSTQHGA